MRVFAMDEERMNFVIFCIDREDDLNAYVWIDPDGGSKQITDIYGLCAYCRQTTNPLFVGSEMPQDMIDGAYEVLGKMSDEEKNEILEKFNEHYKKYSDEEYDERKEYEEEMMREIENMDDKKYGVMYFM